MGTHPIFESDFDCLTDKKMTEEENDRTKEDSFEIVENPPPPDNTMSHKEKLYWKEMKYIIELRDESANITKEMIELKRQRAILRKRNAELKKKAQLGVKSE